MTRPLIRIGSRKSALALKQTELVSAALKACDKLLEVEVVPVVTSGDRKQGTPQAAQGDKKDWIAELENLLAAGEIDLAVHSAKDVPIDIHPDTFLQPVLARATPFEALLLNPTLDLSGQSLAALPQNSSVGTASLRREAQIRWIRPDLKIVPVRGNVPTRVRKLTEENLSSVVLAAAGLDRLGLLTPHAVILNAKEMLPAVNQGILVAQLRKGDNEFATLVSAISEPRTFTAFEAERAVIAKLGADCHSAVAVFADFFDSQLRLRAEVYAQKDRMRVDAELIGAPLDASLLGVQVAELLLERGAVKYL